MCSGPADAVGLGEVGSWHYRVLGFHGRVTGPAGVVAELRGLFPAPPAWAVADDAAPAHLHPTTVLAARPVGEPGGPAASGGAAAPARPDAPGGPGEPGRPSGFVVALDGTDRWTAEDERELVPTLEWPLTQAAVDDIGGRYVLLHGGAVARNGRALVMPAASGSGKSTLVAGLVAAGFRLASDEIAAIDPSDGLLRPFARALCVKQGSRPVLAARYPILSTAPPRYRLSGEAVWYLMPDAAGWIEAPTPVRVVVLPRYVAGAATELTPVPRSAALPRLLEQSFSVRQHGARGIATITALLQAAGCYSLTIGTLDDAIELLTRLTDG